MNLFQLFGALLCAHALCDYPLQGDFLSRAKNRTSPLPGVPWWQALGAHALIHAGAVGLLTGVWWLGALEGLSHFAIDDAKCRHKLDFNQDQGLHVACKVLWVLAVLALK